MHFLSVIAISFVIALTTMVVIIRFGPRWMAALAVGVEKERQSARLRAPIFVEEMDELRPEDDPYWDLRRQLEKLEEEERSSQST